MKRTQIGSRRERILIEAPTLTRGATGQEIIEWDTVCEIWTKIEYKDAGSKEDLMGDQPTAQTSVVFDILYRSGLTEKMRITYKGQYYDILFIQEPDYRTTLLLHTQKRI